MAAMESVANNGILKGASPAAGRVRVQTFIPKISALNLEQGEIITTPFTFVSTTHAIVRCGFTPVFCDVEPDYFTLDAKLLEAKITPRTRAILPVHVYGNPCDMEAIERIAETFTAWREVEKYSRIVTRDEIAKNDYNISPSRYIHTGAGEEYRPLEEIVEELDALEAEAKETDKALRKILKQIGVGA
jgi:hypothetical protein